MTKEGFIGAVLVFTAVLIGSAVPVCAQLNRDTRDYINRCYKAIDPGVIIGTCSSAIESWPRYGMRTRKFADLYVLRGLAYARMCDYTRAIQDYDEALRLNPNHVGALQNRDRSYRNEGADVLKCPLAR